jgi:hypothetical protein
MRFIFEFLAGGVNLPDRLGRLINDSEVQQLGRDMGNAVKKP